MKEKHIKSTQLKFLRIDPFYEMNIKSIELSHLGDLNEVEFSHTQNFYELGDYLMTYSFVTKLGDDVVGFCLLTILPNQYGFTSCVVVDHFKVAKSFENRGIAQSMFNHIKKIQKNTESNGMVFHCHEKSATVDHLIAKWNFEPINTLLYKSKTLA